MRQWKYAWLIMLCCLASTFSYAFTSYEINDQCRVDLNSISKVKTDSNLQLPQAGWEAVKMLPDRWDMTWPDYSGGAWYKLEWTWQCKNDARLAEPIVFSLDYINSAGAVFLNGDMLWSDRHLQEPLSKSWNMPRLWVMPISGLENGSNEILIYVYGYAVQSAGIGKISFNNVMQANAAQQQKIWNTRTLFQINIILSGVLGIICLVIWLFRRSESSFGWFALSSLLWIFFTSHVLAAETAPFPNSLAASRANLCFFILYILCFCIYLLRFISVRKPKLERAMLLLTAGFILSIWTVSLSMMKPLFGTVFLFYCGVFLLMYLYLCWTAFRTRHAESIFLAVCMTAIVSFAVFDVYMVYADISNDIAPLSPYTSPLITLFIVVILGARLTCVALQPDAEGAWRLDLPALLAAITPRTKLLVVNSAAQGETIEDVLPKFLDFSKGAVMVAHNAGFDMSFIIENCKRLGIEQEFTYVDTVGMARFLLPALNRFKLDTVAKAVGVSLDHHHREIGRAHV